MFPGKYRSDSYSPPKIVSIKAIVLRKVTLIQPAGGHGDFDLQEESLARMIEKMYLFKTLKALILTSGHPQKVQENKQCSMQSSNKAISKGNLRLCVYKELHFVSLWYCHV